MARVIAYTILSPNHVFPFVSILLALKKRGYDVQFIVYSTDSNTKARRDHFGGIRFREIGPSLSASATESYQSQVADHDQRDEFVRHGELSARALDEVLPQLGPDFLLVDPILWGGMIAAEASGIPWASLSHNPLTLRGLGVDVRGPGFPPPRTIIGRTLHRGLRVILSFTEASPLPEINAVRSTYRLSPLSDAWDRFLTAPLILATTSEPFEYPRSDWPSSIRFVGPLLWEPAAKAPAWLGERTGRPLVLLAGSSVIEAGEARSWTGMALEALRDEPIEVLATLPNGNMPVHVPGNARVVSFLPHGLVLPYTACVICHGGSGITHRALASGVPVVAVPFGLDRFEVARRVEVSEAGVMLPGQELTPERLRQALRKAIQCKPGAERIAAAFGRAGGAPAAADAIERCLRGGGIPHGQRTNLHAGGWTLPAQADRFR